MTVRKCLVAGWLSCLGASGLAPMASAQGLERYESARINVSEPQAAPNQNQKTADAIVAALRGNPQLKGYRIDVVVVEGVAELHGQVISPAQRDLARQTALAVAGVNDLRDQMTIRGSELLPTAQEFVPNAPAFPPQPNPIVTPMMPQPGMQAGPMPMPGGYPGGPGGGGEPVAAFHTHNGALPNPQYQPPPLPPYAWPTYAPYNNYSRVATPKQFAHSQWPFIGPMYPYPKVPLGWRRVTLEWQDGSWWYGRESNSHDWWRVRYW